MSLAPLAPIQPHARLREIDVLRGFAIFGILVVNMAFFASPVPLLIMELREVAGADQIAAWLITFLAESKFFSLFSFLFGFGLFMQMERAASRGQRFVPRYLRRLFVLLLFGLIHAFYFWVGDILYSYALLGCLLLFFRRRSPRALLLWAVFFLSLIVLFNAALLGVFELGRSMPDGEEMLAQNFARSNAEYRALSERILAVYPTGSFTEIFQQRQEELGFQATFYPYIYPNIFAMFLIGLYFGKRGYFKDIAAHLPFFKKIRRWGLLFGLAGELLYVFLGEFSSPAEPSGVQFLRASLHAFSAPALSLGYMSIIVLLFQNETWRVRLHRLAPVGRMALSNYLLQTLVCTTLFLGYGFGLYGQVGPALGLVIAVVIFGLQIPFSRWWLERFQFGPLEWLWRSLTYMKLQPLRVRPASQPAPAES